MAKASKDKSDDLEIVSIGNLYTGAWEKKYWSCSRGKDRYPYPVGFRAVRTQNGITYRMEISEGLKGPLFTIGSNDGLSCSGQTPDIAWEKFQKKGCSQPKLWRGKRFSCKIDGMEFFGFKNSLIQRLLRELVANVGGATKQNLLPSFICDTAANTGDPIPETDLSTCPDLLPDLKKHGVTRKRSRKGKIANAKDGAGLKKSHSQTQGRNADASNTRPSSQGNHSSTCSATVSTSFQNELDNSAEALQISEHSGTQVMNENLLASAENDLHMNSLDVCDSLEVDRIDAVEETKHASCTNDRLLEENGNLANVKETVNGSIIKDEDRLGQSYTKIINDSQLCAPDTFDHPPDTAISEVLMTEPYPEGDRDAGSWSLSSENADFDSIGQEVVNTMMTMLLPQALPLLKTFSRKKRNKLKAVEKSKLVCMDENKNTLAVLSPVRGLKETSDLHQIKKDADSSGTTNSCADHLESVAPDSIDNGSEDTSREVPMFPDIMVADESPMDPEICQCVSILESEAGPPGCHLGATDSKTELVSNEGPPGVGNLITKSSIDFTFPCKRDTSTNFGHNTLFAGPRSKEENAKTLPDHIEDIHDPANSCKEKCETCDMKEIFQDKDLPKLDRSITDLQNQTVFCSRINDNVNWKHEDQLQDILKIVACYIHPMPILTVLLSRVGNDIYLCLLCGSLAQEDKTLFVYNAQITGETAGCPAFVGHSSVSLPYLKDYFGRNIVLQNSGLQFTPDAQSLVLANSIRVPCCRVGNIHCPCASCSSDYFGDNALKIVQVKVGYVSVVTTLKTAQTVRCLLVCEPNHLLAADVSGKLYLWVMNSSWSEQMEECYLSIPEHMSSSLVELKRIPNSAAFVVGHDGYGQFGLWNVDKRILISKFSAPRTSISKCLPISLFQWQGKWSFSTYSNPEKLIDEVLDATKMSFSGSTEDKLALSMDSKDIAIWLLISTTSDPYSLHGYQSGDLQNDGVGCWKLALLVKNTVIMGSALDHRAAAIGASSGHGIIGRSDGLVYMWELSTGIKVGDLHQFKGTGVSCISTDGSNSGAVAIASEEGQLLLYMHN